MTGVSFFSCCRESPLPGAAVDEPGPTLWTAPAGELPDRIVGPEVLGRVLLPATRSIAVHEGAHACAQIALGGTVISATIEMQPHVHASGDLGYAARTVMTLAAPAAEAWARSEITRIPDDELGPWIAAIRGLRGGGCDRCRAVRSTIVAVRHASNEIVIAEFRRLENIAGIVVRSPPVWAAIQEIATALMLRGTLDGETVHEICARHFEPGLFAMKETI